MAFLVFVFIAANVSAAEYPGDLWKGILREAADQGYKGMYAVACVVRNRYFNNMDDGLSGMHRRDLQRFVDKHPRRFHAMARRALADAFATDAIDITHGATQFESTRFRDPWWCKNMLTTAIILDHVFYRPKKGVKIRRSR